MSQWYTQTYLLLETNQEQHDWLEQAHTSLKRVLESESADEEPRPSDVAVVQETTGPHDFFPDYVGFELCRVEEGTELYADEVCNIDLLAVLIRSFKKKFNDQSMTVFTYSCTSDYTGPDTESGGLVAVTQGVIYVVDAGNIKEQLENPGKNEGRAHKILELFETGL